jgi:predicted permease
MPDPATGSLTFPIESLLPIFGYFLIGMALRRLRIATPEHADFLFRIIFLVTLPALVFLSVSQANLTRHTALLPVNGFLINIACASIAATLARFRKLPAEQAGAIVVCAAIINMGFAFPIILATQGPSALAEAVFFDVGNAIFVATLAWPIAQFYGRKDTTHLLRRISRVLLSPIFIALALAVLTNLASIDSGELVKITLAPLGSATVPLMLIAIGMSFSGFSIHSAGAIIAVAARMLFGGVLACLFVWMFGFQGVTATVVVVSAAAPVGASAAAVAAVSGLNRDLAVNAISISALAGLFTLPALLFIASRVFA